MMGEMADMDIDRLWEQGYERWLEDGQPSQFTCRFCNVVGLYWDDRKLMGPDGLEHKCKPKVSAPKVLSSVELKAKLASLRAR